MPEAKETKDEGFGWWTLGLVALGSLGLGVAGGYILRDMEEPEKPAATK